MLQHRILILAVLVFGVPVFAAEPKPKPEVVFEDCFSEKLGEGWSWLRENSDAWRIKEKANVKNALVRRAPDRSQGSFAIKVTVTNTTEPTQQFEQAGITWYKERGPSGGTQNNKRLSCLRPHEHVPTGL